jgi:hypothetical protein
MKTIRIHTFIIFAFTFVLSSCVPENSSKNSLTPTNDLPIATINSPIPTHTSTSTLSSPPNITGMNWDSANHVINIDISPWPKSWSPWTTFIDGIEIPMEEEPSAIVVRPNAPLEQPPDGLIIGTLPWVTGLDHVDFPCCGVLQFSVPEMGVTNAYQYNLRDSGCLTASTKICPVEWTMHEGDWVIEGTEVKNIEATKVIQKGNIYVRDSATLVITNSELRMERGRTPTIHVYIFVDPNATLIIDNSLIYPGPESGGLACVINHGTTSMIDSPTSIHYFDMSDGATLMMENSEMIYEIGGLLQVTGGNTTVTNSTIGALGLSVPAGAHLNASDLKSGTYFENWKVQDMIPDANYDLTLDKVTILKDDFTGELEHGPYERGWIFFLDPDAHVRLSDSELRKVFIEVRNDTAKFENLKIGEPSNLIYRDIVLENIVVEGEWPFTIIDANVTITDSNYLFLQPSGSSTIKLVNSHIVELIPREFSGTIIFENGSWSNAGEIIGGVEYHSKSNNFTISGSLKIDDSIRTNLQWKNAQVKREFDVILTDSQGNPIHSGVIKVDGYEYLTNENGLTKFSLDFNDTNYNQPIILEAWYLGKLIDQQVIDFFAETPIRLNQ